MSASKEVRTYSRWASGSSAAASDSVGEYNSVNAQVYENGNLGPRPGWKEIGEGAFSTFVPGTDTLQSIQWYRETGGVERRRLLLNFWDDSGSHDEYEVLNLNSNTWSAGAAIASLPSSSDFQALEHDDSDSQVTSFDGQSLLTFGGYVTVVGSTNIGTPLILNTPDSYPLGATAYRERFYYWGFVTNPGRIYYSVAANYANWDDGTQAGNATWTSALSFFDISYDTTTKVGAVIGVWSVKNALIIARKDARWLVLTGTSPDNGTLRELGRDQVPNWNSACVVDNELYFLDTTGKGIVIATPSFVEATQLDYLSPTAYPSSTAERPDRLFSPREAVGDEVTSDIFLPARESTGDSPNLVAAERINQSWNLSKWTWATTGLDVSFTAARPNEMYAMIAEASDAPVFSRNLTLNRPANSGDDSSVALSLEANTASGTDVIVDLATIEAEDSKLLRPVKVVIDIDYWKGGNYSAPTLAIDSTVEGIEADTPIDTSAQIVVDPSGWDSSVGDLPLSRRVSRALPQLQFGSSAFVRLTFNNLALYRVRVYYESIDDVR